LGRGAKKFGKHCSMLSLWPLRVGSFLNLKLYSAFWYSAEYWQWMSSQLFDNISGSNVTTQSNSKNSSHKTKIIISIVEL
jgi:hypothetical protein